MLNCATQHGAQSEVVPRLNIKKSKVVLFAARCTTEIFLHFVPALCAGVSIGDPWTQVVFSTDLAYAHRLAKSARGGQPHGQMR